MSEQRVSDERLAALVQSAEWRTTVMHKRLTTTDQLALDLQSARARIAALEAVANGIMADYGDYLGSMDLGCAEALSDIVGRIAALATTTEQDIAQVSGKGE